MSSFVRRCGAGMGAKAGHRLPPWGASAPTAQAARTAVWPAEDSRDTGGSHHGGGRHPVSGDNCQGSGIQPRFLERFSADDFMD